MLLFTFLYYFRIDNGKWDKIVNQIPQAVALGDTNIDNRKKLQFITLLTAICIVSHIENMMIKVILLRAPCQNVNVRAA